MTDEQLEDFIVMKVIVDCYNEYEVAISWYIFAQDNLAFPFQASWDAEPQAGLQRGERVTVIGLEDEDECRNGIEVEARAKDGALVSLPLESLLPVDARGDATHVWRYGVAHGFGFSLDAWEEE